MTITALRVPAGHFAAAISNAENPIVLKGSPGSWNSTRPVWDIQVLPSGGLMRVVLFALGKPIWRSPKMGRRKVKRCICNVLSSWAGKRVDPDAWKKVFSC